MKVYRDPALATSPKVSTGSLGKPYRHGRLLSLFIWALITSSHSAFAFSAEIARPLPCAITCISYQDYQHPDTPLQFSRNLTQENVASDSHSMVNWRHRYSARVTRDGDNRIIFDHFGQAHVFRALPDGSYEAVSSTSINDATVADTVDSINNNGESGKSETLQRRNGFYIWRNKENIETVFQGSFPVELRFPDEQWLKLNYDGLSLRQIVDKHGNRITLSTSDSDPPRTRVQMPNGSAVLVDEWGCTFTTEHNTRSCQTAINPENGFGSTPLPTGAHYLDARPASCRSYFLDYYGTTRGDQIERGLAELPPYAHMLHTNRSFPIIDFIDGSNLVIVRSRDLTSPSFNRTEEPNALYERLMRDGKQIERRFLEPLQEQGFLTHTEQGRITHITHSSDQHLQLHVLIQQDMASASHWSQIERARQDLQRRHDISLHIVVIP